MSKIDKMGPYPEKRHLGRCWIWTASIAHHGYGEFNAGTNGPTVRAHRWFWLQVKGPIPDGMFLDHKCRVRHCVRPSHLRVVTPKENVLCGETLAARKKAQTHCVHGHSLEGAYIAPNGTRICRHCTKIRGALRYRRKHGLPDDWVAPSHRKWRSIDTPTPPAAR